MLHLQDRRSFDEAVSAPASNEVVARIPTEPHNLIVGFMLRAQVAGILCAWPLLEAEMPHTGPLLNP